MPNNVYSTTEKVYFVKEFFRGTSLRRIANKFVEVNSHRPKPSPATIKNVVKRFNITGNVNREGPYKQPRKAISDEIKTRICEIKKCDNHLSISAIAKSLGISTTSVRAVLRENGLYKSPKGSEKSNETSSNKTEQIREKVNNKLDETLIVDDLFNNAGCTHRDSRGE